MKPARIVATALIAAAALVSGCANTASQEPLSSSSSLEFESTAAHGEIESIEMDRGNIDQAGGSTVSADAKDGNETAKTDPQPEIYRIKVKLDNGLHLTLKQPLVSDLRVGDRVSIEDDRITRE